MADNQVNRHDDHRVKGLNIRTFWKKVAASFLEFGNVG